MILRDKLFLKFIGISCVYFIVVFWIALVNLNSEFWVNTWFSAKFFTYQFAIVYLVGCVIIDRHYSSLNYFRFSSRAEIIKEHNISYVFLAFLITTIAFFIVILNVIIFVDSKNFDDLVLFVNRYFRFFIGLNISGIISLNIKYSNCKHIKNFPQVIPFFLTIGELLIMPDISGIDDLRIMYSWIFSDYIAAGYIVLIAWYTVLFVCLRKRIKRVDLTI